MRPSFRSISAAVFGGLLLATTDVAAQSWSIDLVGSTSRGMVSCSDQSLSNLNSGQSNVQGSATKQCGTAEIGSFDAASLSQVASTSGGQLRSGISMSVSQNSLPNGRFLSGFSYVSFTDNLTFGSSVPVYSIQFFANLSGLFSNITGSGVASAEASVFAMTGSSRGTGNLFIDSNGNQSGNPSVQYLNPSPSLAFSALLALDLRTRAKLGSDGSPYYNVNGSIDADFTHTFFINGIQLFDANGNDISSQATVTSAAGVTYHLGAPGSNLPGDPTVVPEPSTYALLAVGLAAVLGASTRRRRALMA